MPKPRSTPDTPACYAMAMPGLESIAAAEIERNLHGTVKRSEAGIVVFRVPEVDAALLSLRTVDDVFLLAWGTDQLSYKATDLERIRQWTARDVDWQNLLRIHHAIRPKPKGKPSYHLVTQMAGEHGYRRIDARKALVQGLEGKLPASWRLVEENASVEIWLTINGATAVCGLRLSDQTMRHRTYKAEHLPASLRPALAAAMIRLAEARPKQVVLDPMCGAGTILAEQMQGEWSPEVGKVKVWGGDLDPAALRAAGANLRRLGRAHLVRWDARRLPLPDQCVERIVSNPPFGKQLGKPEDIGPLYRRMVREYDRVLSADGRVVLLVADGGLLREAVRDLPWKRLQELRVRVLGQLATLSVWQKTGARERGL